MVGGVRGQKDGETDREKERERDGKTKCNIAKEERPRVGRERKEKMMEGEGRAGGSS